MTTVPHAERVPAHRESANPHPWLARIPPVLAPPTLGALLRGGAATLALTSGRDGLAAQATRLFPGTALVGAFESGRAALAAALESAMRWTGRRTVVLPAFTSFSVAAAAAAVGARVRLCDVRPDTLDCDPAALAACLDDTVAAVVLGNLFGWPSEVPVTRARAVGAVVIDDAAQALGAADHGASVGGRGELGVLSFGRGKCVTVGDGGVLLVRHPALAAVAGDLVPQVRAGSLRPLVLAWAVRAARRPWVFGAVTRTGVGGVGESVYDPGFPRRGAARSADAMAVGIAERATQEAAARSRVAERWREHLAGLQVTMPRTRSGAAPAYLRFPVLAPDPTARDAWAGALAKAGFAHVRTYPVPLGRVGAFRAACCPDAAETPGGAALAERLLALPCHGGVDVDAQHRAARGLCRRAHHW